MSQVMILGGRSDMALACAHAFAGAGYDIVLAARRSETLGPEKADIELRYGVTVGLRDFDALDVEGHEDFAAVDPLPDIVICAVGRMGEQDADHDDVAASVAVMRSNYEGPAAILGAYATRMVARGMGTIVGISSVAGDRGRATNYIYGSAKAGFTAFLSGLRNRLAKRGVHVMTVKPGFVATKMTEGMDLPDKLTADPDKLARAVLHAAKMRRNIIYVKPVWWLVMLIIRNIPEAIFKKLSI